MNEIPKHLAAIGVNEDDVILLKRDAVALLGNPSNPTLAAWIKDPDHPLPEPFWVGRQRAWTLGTIRKVRRELVERAAQNKATAARIAAYARAAIE